MTSGQGTPGIRRRQRSHGSGTRAPRPGRHCPNHFSKEVRRTAQVLESALGEDALQPRPEHKFTFGLWTVGNTGSDPFGTSTRPRIDPNESVHRLAALGAYGVCFHDDDLVPPGSSLPQRDEVVRRFKATLDETGMAVSMATTNLFGNPVFKDGAFTSNDREVRRYAIAKTMRAIDLGAELGAPVYVFWVDAKASN